MVKVSHEMYAIPLADVIETVKISFNDITTIEAREVVNLRGEILSLLRLNEFVGIESSLREGKDKISVVVVGYGNRKIGIVVDQLEGKLEIVIKSLDENYTNIEGFSGASILGDGTICLILDIASMINKVITDEEKFTKKRKSERLIFEPDAGRESESPERKKATKDLKSDFISFDDAVESKPAAPPPGITRAAEKPVEIFTEKKEKPAEIKLDKIFDTAAPAKEKEIKPAETMNKSEAKMDISEDVLFKKDELVPATPAEKKIEMKTEAPADKDQPVPDAGKKSEEEEDIAKRIRDTLSDFRKELEDNIKLVDDGSDYLMNALQINEGDMDRISMIMNVGIANAAESLSRIIDKEISISIPDVKVVPIKSIPETLGDVDTVYLGVHMPIIGDIKGSILFSLSEDSGYKMIDMLYGTPGKKTRALNEDGESALVEVTNIVGSSVLNTIADKIEMSVRPDVPTIIHDYIQSTIDSIIVMNNIKDEYALYMDTLFFYQDNSILGKMLILSETESLKRMIEKLRDV
jgi:two-component system chemotaxis sensor kinase CheA